MQFERLNTIIATQIRIDFKYLNKIASTNEQINSRVSIILLKSSVIINPLEWTRVLRWPLQSACVMRNADVNLVHFTFQSDQWYNSSSLHSKLQQPRKHDSPSRTQQRAIQCDYPFIASLAYLLFCNSICAYELWYKFPRNCVTRRFFGDLR